MRFLHLSKKNLQKIRQIIHASNLFVFYYLDGCGPCSALRPIWKQLSNQTNRPIIKKNATKKIYPLQENDGIVVADINQTLFKNVASVKETAPTEFPTIRFIKNKNTPLETKQEYNGTRDLKSLQDWIHLSSRSIFKTKQKKTKQNKTKRPTSWRAFSSNSFQL